MSNIPGMSYFKLAKGESLTDADLNIYTEEIQNLFKVFPQEVEGLRDILSREYDKIYAIGIGDSLYSADSVRLAFIKNTKKNIEVIESHEFNNYFIDYMPKNSLVFICSGGGAAARTSESYYLAKKRGATVVAVTITEKSRLRSAADYSLLYKPRRDAYLDGSTNYMALTAMMLVIGIKIGVWGGALSESEEKALYEKSVKVAVTGFVTCMNNEEMMREMMTAARSQDKFYFFGAGPSYILTKYGAAKFMEQAAVDGICEQLEEYGHEQYWVHNRKGHGDYIFTICPEGKSIQRCIENLREQKYLNLTTIVLTTGGYCNEIKDLATYIIATPEPVDEDYYWFVAGNVFARLANFYTEAIGLMGKKFGTDEQFAEHYRTIHYSRFCPEVAEFDITCPDEETIRNVGALGLEFEKKE